MVDITLGYTRGYGGYYKKTDASGPYSISTAGVVTLLPGTTSGSSGGLSESDFDTKTGSLTETAPVTDTASSGINGRMQRVAQRLTSLIAIFPTALGGTTSANSFPVVLSSDGPFTTQTGSITETAPASDTASSGLNGRLQRIAQRLTSLIAQLPSLVTMTERSSTVTAGGTSQQLAAANASRRYLFIQNPNTTAGQGVTAENLYIRFGAVAAGIDNGTAIELLPGASLTYESLASPTQAIQVIAATTAHKFIAMEG